MSDTPKPQPKSEIVIGIKTVTSNGGLLWIYTASADAYTWIETEALQFGTLFPPNENSRHFVLFIDPFYDVDEVEAYLLSYLKD